MIHPAPTPIFAPASPTAPRRPGDAPGRTPRQEWRRKALLEHMVDPAVVAEDAALVEAQARDIHGALKPRDGLQGWLTTTIAVTITRLNRCDRVERKLRDLAALRAIDCWDDDQRLAAEELALKLAKQPARTVLKLQATAAGVDWLLARWRFLAAIDPPAWTDPQRALAVQLAGADPTVDPAAPGFAQARVDELARRRPRAAESDAVRRGLVEADLSDEVPGLAALRRQARALQRHLKWCVDQFHLDHTDRWDDPRRRPAHLAGYDATRLPNSAHIEGAPADHDEVWRHLRDPNEPPRSTPTSRWLAAEAAAEAEAAALAHAAALASDETNPTAPETEIDETNPTAPETPIDETNPPTFVHDYSNERGRNHSRPRRAGEPSREYARQLARARYRTDLALAEMS